MLASTWGRYGRRDFPLQPFLHPTPRASARGLIKEWKKQEAEDEQTRQQRLQKLSRDKKSAVNADKTAAAKKRKPKQVLGAETPANDGASSVFVASSAPVKQSIFGGTSKGQGHHDVVTEMPPVLENPVAIIDLAAKRADLSKRVVADRKESKVRIPKETKTTALSKQPTGGAGDASMGAATPMVGGATPMDVELIEGSEEGSISMTGSKSRGGLRRKAKRDKEGSSSSSSSSTMNPSFGASSSSSYAPAQPPKSMSLLEKLQQRKATGPGSSAGVTMGLGMQPLSSLGQKSDATSGLMASLAAARAGSTLGGGGLGGLGSLSGAPRPGAFGSLAGGGSSFGGLGGGGIGSTGGGAKLDIAALLKRKAEGADGGEKRAKFG